MDPTQLLLTLGASVSLTDRNRNTALHRAVLGKNQTAMCLLLKNGANPHLKNIHGDSAIELAEKFQLKLMSSIFADHKRRSELPKDLARFTLVKGLEIRIPSWRDPSLRLYLMALTPLTFFYLFGKVFDIELDILLKVLLVGALVGSLYALFMYAFDHKRLNILAISLYLSTKFWLYVTFIEYFLLGMFSFLLLLITSN